MTTVNAGLETTTDRFGPFGGRYVPETLIPALDELEVAFRTALGDAAFRQELDELLREYVGRPTALGPRFCRGSPAVAPSRAAFAATHARGAVIGKHH